MMTDTTTPSALMDAADLAALLRVSKATVWRLRENLKLPPAIALTSQCLRWRRSDVESWLAAGCPPFNDKAQSTAHSEAPHE